MRKPKFTFKIDRNIPIPTSGREQVYLLAKLKVGDSFRLPLQRMASVRVIITKRRKSFPKEKYTFRRLDNKSYRCWRVK